MTYAQFSSIDAVDYNTLVGGNPVTTIGTLNAVWGTGAGAAGYGQTPEGNVTVGSTVSASKWANLVNTTANSATHQGTTITSVAAPVAGGSINYISALSTNLTSIYNNRLNAATQGTTTSNSVTYGATWSSQVTFTHTVTFANGDAARYFFNSGGQLAITCSHTNGPGINSLLNTLASDTGTVVLSAMSSGSATIAGIPYNGITKVGGANLVNTTISPNSGYYALTTGNANVFTQTASTGPVGYLSTYIRIIAQSNGTQGSNGDAGSVITLYTIWDEVPNGLVATATTNTTLTVRAPEQTNIANTWGSISISGTASGT